MAQAVVEERQLLKTLRWYDGFVIALANPGFLLGGLGYSVLDLGGWGAAFLWGLTALIIVPVMVLYSELAAMFPNKSGGFSALRERGLAQVHDDRRSNRHIRLLDRLVGRARLPRIVLRLDRASGVVPGRAVRDERIRRRLDRRRVLQYR